MPQVSLPLDDTFAPEQSNQWWYWTGHLKTRDSNRHFGFQITFFSFDFKEGLFMDFLAQLIGRKTARDWLGVQMVQHAIADVEENNFKFRVNYLKGLPEVVKDRFVLYSEDKEIRAEGSGKKNSLYGKVDKYTLDLKDVYTTKPPTLRYDGQYHEYSFGGYSYYYSRENMEAKGTLTIDNKTYDVEGKVWFDRQYGQLAFAVLLGWQWFAVELDDNTSIMLFHFHRSKPWKPFSMPMKGSLKRIRYHNWLFRPLLALSWKPILALKTIFKEIDVTTERFGTITTSDGTIKNLGPDDYTVKILDWWTSPHTLRPYPSKWNIQIGDLNVIVTPQIADQEIYGWQATLFPRYWEGTCSVTSTETGKAIGKAYVELNGYPPSLYELFTLSV